MSKKVSRIARELQGATHRLMPSEIRVATTARRTAGEITRQRLMPPAKQPTISCSVCSRFSATRVATNSAIGRIMPSSWGRARAMILKNTIAVWRCSISTSNSARLRASKASAIKANVASSVGPRNWRKR